MSESKSILDGLITKDMQTEIDNVMTNILYLETLEPRNMDSLDFHELSVNQIKRALVHMYQAGQKAK